MLKRWHPRFYLDTKRVRFHHLWVHLLGFKLSMWNKEAFTTVGNHLGHFLYIGEEILKGIYQIFCRMFVEIGLAKILLEKLEIE